VEVVGYEADEARISHFYKWGRFKERHWIPLYKARGLQWHDEEEI